MGRGVSQTDQEKIGKVRRKEKSLRLVFQDLFPLHSGKNKPKKKANLQTHAVHICASVARLCFESELHFSYETWWEFFLPPSIVKSSNSEVVLLQCVCVCSYKPTQIPLGSKHSINNGRSNENLVSGHYVLRQNFAKFQTNLCSKIPIL